MSQATPSDWVRTLKPGDRVHIDSHEGFGGPATVVEARRHVPSAHCKVLMDDGSQPAFWAHDFEVGPPAEEPSGPYDSRADTVAHIIAVRERLGSAIRDLCRRQDEHDRSKLRPPEKAAFDEFTPRLRASTYGGPEYEAMREAIAPALAHHYAANRHHPEHFPDGVRGMTLVDVLEMLCDWKAATGRHADGDLAKSIEINQRRFGYGDEMRAVLTNTAREMDWL